MFYEKIAKLVWKWNKDVGLLGGTSKRRNLTKKLVAMDANKKLSYKMSESQMAKANQEHEKTKIIENQYLDH